tara:strand:+ start:10555 stop:10809 length:255 start_codon:yes stop_codon:yes gene_type:complete
MKSKKPYRKNDKVIVETFAGPNISVILKERYLVVTSELKLGVDGWEALIYKQKDVENLRKHGVPYKKGEKPIVFVADWQIIKKC